MDKNVIKSFICTISVICLVISCIVVSGCNVEVVESERIKYNEMFTSTQSLSTSDCVLTAEPGASVSVPQNSDVANENNTPTQTLSSTENIVQSAKPTSGGNSTNGQVNVPISTQQPSQSTGITTTAGTDTNPSSTSPVSGTAKPTSGVQNTFVPPEPDITWIPTATPAMTPMPPNYYLLTVKAEFGGSVYIETDHRNPNITQYGFEAGSYPTIHAVASDGWRFDGWYIGDDYITGEAVYQTFCMPAQNHTLTARFVLI